MSPKSKTPDFFSREAIPSIMVAFLLAVVLFMFFDRIRSNSEASDSANDGFTQPSLRSKVANMLGMGAKKIVKPIIEDDIDPMKAMGMVEPFGQAADEDDELKALGMASKVSETFAEPDAAPVCPPGGTGIHKVYMGKPLLDSDSEENCLLGNNSVTSKCSLDMGTKQAPFFNQEFTTSVMQAIDNDPSRMTSFTPPQATTQNFDLRASPAIPFQGKPPSSSYVNAVMHQGLKTAE